MKQAKDLISCDMNGLSDPYVKLSVDQIKDSKKKTDIVKKSLSPEYNETFTWSLPDTMVATVRTLIHCAH